MLITALFLPGTPPSDCAAFAARIDEPVAITATPIPGRALGAVPIRNAQPTSFAIGPFVYRGHGLTIRSSDPRFREITLPPSREAAHPCGAAVDGPTGWNAASADLQRWTLRFRRPAPPPSPGAVQAAALGASATLPGYRLIASWPVRTYYFGLMHPLDPRRRDTLIVAFPSGPGRHRARALARLPTRYASLSVLPDMHRPFSFVRLEGKADDGAWHRVVLEASDAVLAKIGTELPN